MIETPQFKALLDGLERVAQGEKPLGYRGDWEP
jgi:hypothetical protein